MDKYDMVQVWKVKLAELELQKELMIKDNQFTEENLADMDEMIINAKQELAKAIREAKEDDYGQNDRSR